MNLPHTGATDTARQSSSSANPEALVDEHGDCLYRYAVMRVRHPEVAEDLVQETLLAAVRTQTSFRGTSSERSWLYGIQEQDLRSFSEACPRGFLYRFRVFGRRDVSQIH